MPKITNVVFGQLAANVLCDALVVRGAHEETIVFPDDLSFGPIDVLTGPDRAKWLSDNCRLRTDEWSVFPQKLGAFFGSINAIEGKIICWFCENAVDELCGFSALADNFAGANLFAIKTTTFAPRQLGNRSKVPNEAVPLKLAHVNPSIATQLLGTEIAVSAAQRTELLTVWRKVRLENAEFRSIDVDGLKSVPTSYFDQLLLNRITPKWQFAQRVVTFAAMDADRGEFFRVTIVALAGRLLQLANAGTIKIQGNINNWPTIEVCKP